MMYADEYNAFSHIMTLITYLNIHLTEQLSLKLHEETFLLTLSFSLKFISLLSTVWLFVCKEQLFVLGCVKGFDFLRYLPVYRECVLAWAVWLPHEITLDIYLLSLHFHPKEKNLGSLSAVHS